MIVCVGAAHIDEVVRLENALHPGASNPARWSQSIGGVAANTAIAASHDTDAMLIAALGDDAAGTQLQSYFHSALTSQPANALHTITHRASGRYCAVLDQEGELVIGLAETDIAEELDYQTIKKILSAAQSTPDILVVDANLSHQCLRDICTHKPAPLLAALTVSPVKAMRLADHGGSIDLLLTNRREAATLTGLPVQAELQRLSPALVAAGFSQHVITDGASDILVCSEDDTQIVTVDTCSELSGVNGAGDALAGATLAGISQGMTLIEAVGTRGTAASRRVVTGETPPPTLNFTH